MTAQPHNPPGTVAFVDVETTSALPHRIAWELAVIVRRPDAATTEEFHCFIDVDDLQLEHADVRALQVGKFHQRHPQVNTRRPLREPDIEWVSGALSEYEALQQVEWLTRGAQLVAWNVGFDAQTLDARMRYVNIVPSFDYHHIELRSLVLGFIAGRGIASAVSLLPHWSAKDLTYTIDVPEVPEEQRHTALGDARWHMSIFDQVTGYRSPPLAALNLDKHDREALQQQTDTHNERHGYTE